MHPFFLTNISTTFELKPSQSLTRPRPIDNTLKELSLVWPIVFLR